MSELFQFIDASIQQIQIASNTLYVLMSTKPNHQLEFFIKLTQIIGRAFTDIQQLLTSQLRRQQSDALTQSVPINPSPTQQPLQQISHNLVNLASHLQVLPQDDRKQSPEQGENNKQQIVERSQRNVKKSTRIKKRPKLGNSKFVLKEKKKRKRKTNKIEGKPCPPLNAFMLFLNDNKYEIMNKKPELSPSQVTIYASTLWNGFDQSEKQTYLEIYKKNHGIYLQEMRKYKEQIGKKDTKDTRKQEKQEDKKIPEIQNSFKAELKPKMKTRIKKRKFIRNQVISVESSSQHQLN